MLAGHQFVFVVGTLSAGIGGMAAIHAGLCARLTGDRRAGWICAAVAVYSFISVPTATIQLSVGPGSGALGNVRLLGNVLFVLMVIVAVRAPAVPPLLTRLSVPLGLVLALSAAAVLVGLRHPEPSLAVTGLRPPRVVMAGLVVLGGAALVRLGLGERSRGVVWTGLGVVTIGVAQLMRVAAGGITAPPELTNGAVRLVGIGLVLLGACTLAGEALRVVDRNRLDQREQLRRARADLHRRVERDHELRNGLAGLAAVTEVLTADRDRARALGPAVTSELARLHELLRVDRAEPGNDAPGEGRLSYRLEPVLRERVVMRRSAGMDIELTCDRRLRVTGSPSRLAQAVVNVLANCERHAPGSEVRVRVTRTDDAVLVRISDSGPGVPSGGEVDVFGEGVRGADSPGEGLGLHLVRTVLAADGASAYIESVPGAGCTVVLRLTPADIGPVPDIGTAPDTAAHPPDGERR
jgi:two-component system OmpR family sensor kinase